MFALNLIFIIIGILHSVQSWDYCGGKTFSPAFELCCYGKVVKQSGLNGACCGYQGYSQNWEVCCNGVVLKKSIFDTQCCGFQLYNPSWNICCFGVLHKKFGNSQCCGQKVFDPKWEQCCFGNTIPRNSNCHGYGWGKRSNGFINRLFE
jgi:hypothetical protein